MTNSYKFRAWDKKIKAMFPIFTLSAGKQEVLGVQSYCPNLINCHFVASGGIYRLIEEVELMQFTGLLDKNGKEIYEGDILESIYKNQYGTFKKRISVNASEQYKGGGEYDDETVIGGWLIETKTCHPLESFEVIGNIYESKHLLDNKE